MGWGQTKNIKQEKSKRKIAGFSSWTLFLVGVCLTGFGLLMIYSSSAMIGLQKYADSLYFVKKQILFLTMGWILYFIFAQVPMQKIKSWRLFFLLASFLLLFLVFIPGLGLKGGGAQRWLSLGFLSFQPAELVRLFLVFYIAATLVTKADRLQSFNEGFFPFLTVTGLLMFLLILQPDFGSAMSLFLLSSALWFLGGVPLTYLFGLVILSLPAVVYLVMNSSYRFRRLLAFWDSWSDPQGAGFQIIQSFIAFFRGGWTGVGIGNSEQKLYYLPKAHTDFIFSILGEEMGVIGVGVIVILFLCLLYLGMRIARIQNSLFGYYLALGCTLFLVLPALLNMMVTLGLLPTKGLPLPFLSSGGSSLLVSLMALGILQSLHYRRHEEFR